MSTPEEIKAEYTSSLADLNVNSKPLINVLTILAEENLPNAKIIVEAIEEHLAKVTTDVKLPILYLIDCISKNVGQTYTNLFSQNMVSTFCNVFKMADEKTRSEMFKLRQTWNHIFPEMKLYAIDVQINQIDPAWPVMARPAVKHNSIHFNPRFLLNNSTSSTTPAGTTETPKAATAKPAVSGVQTTPDMETLLMQEQIIKKQKELIEVTKRALEVKVLQTQVKLHEQMLASKIAAAANNNILLKPEVAKQLLPEGITKIKSSLNTNNLSKLQNSQSRINPVNAALLAATRPASRDPRLLKQQLKAVTVSSDVSASTNVSTQKSAAVDNNKDIPTKNSVRDNNIPKDPRLTKVDRKSKGNKSEKSRNSDISSSNSSLTSSSGCLDSPIKNSKRSPTKSKKREKSDSKRSQDYDSGFSKREKYSSKEENHHHHHSESGKDSNNDSSNFKSVKNKNRNYMRRNLNDSPVQQNEDFRSLEQSRANVTEAVKQKSSVESLENKHMDVDLRQIAPAINKKRSSTEASDQVTKKSRSFDVLFGSEDTDLRQLMQQESDTKRSVVERPPTPPPPIISVERNVENLPKKSDLDAVRAKLANATNRDKVLNKSFHKNKLQQQKGDQDLRSQVPSNVTISPEEEKVIQSGHMTNEQGKQMLTKIISQFEKDKLREAKRKDREDGFNDFILNTTSPKEDSENNESSTKFVFNDKDERLNIRPPPLMETPTLDNNQQLFNTRDRRSQFRGVGRDAWRGSRGGRGAIVVGLQPRPPMRGWQHQQQQGRWRGPYNTMRNSESMQTLDDESSKSPNQDFGFELTIDQEANKTLNIDGIPRDIRVYNDVAVIFMNYDDPREISFQNGARRVIFNNKESYLLQFGQDYTEFLVNGLPLRMKLGVPSREVFINDIGYECYFGGPPIHITVNGVTLTVNLDGPPPQVKIAEEKRTDLVVGKINLIINATLMIPVFLDGKIQKFMVDSESCTLQFVDALKKVLINDVPFNVEFGGLPKPFVIHGKKHFIRFSVLPKGVKPGFVKIKEMEGENGTSPLRDNDDGDKHCTALEMEPLRPEPQSKSKDIEDSSNGSKSPNFMNILPSLNNFDALSNVFSQSFASSSTGTGGYQVELPGLESAVPTDNENKPSIPTSIKPILMNANINELFQQLVASGIVKTQEKPVLDSNIIATCTESTPFLNSNENQQKNDIVTENAKPQRKSLATILKMLSFKKPETLKVRQAALYSNLYTGMQCSSCGMRFPPEASMWYSQHLDWHFRQNRKGKKNARIASSRKWYYSLTDWKNYEELEDLEEREKNYFDQQQQQAEVAEEAEDETEIPTVPASSDTTDERCSVCRDVFEQFFNEDKEEWHLRNAIKMDDKTYHPVCYEDHQKSIHDSSLMDDSKVEENNQTKIIPGLEIVLDDDDEIAVNADNDVISLLIDDEKEMKTAKNILSLTEEDKDIEDPVEKHDDEDDDVILNEVAPIKIVVDDDDDDDDEHEPNEARQEIEQQIHIKMEKKSEFDDGFVDVGEIVTLKDVGQVKIKSEPIDNEYPMETPMNTTSSEEVESNENISRNKEVDIEIKDIEGPQITIPATTHAELITASMDGNMELVSNPPLAVTQTINIGSKIKINISKPLPVITPREMNDIGDNSNELSKMYNEPSVEELEIVNYKTALKNVPLRKLPPVQKGSELTGLCSIM